MSKVSLDSSLEKQLLKKIQQGHKEHFTVLYEHYYPFIKSYFKQRNIDDQYSEDLASSVFEKALKSIDNFKWQGLSLSSWLYRISRNLLIDYFRENAASKKTSDEKVLENISAGTDSPEEKAIKKESTLFLTNMLSQLPEREARVIYLKFFEGYTNIQISKEMNLSETNVSTIIWRVICSFREEFTKKGINR